MSSPTQPDRDPYFEAYCAAKAKHEATLVVLKRARTAGEPPDPALMQRRLAAKKAEFAALADLLRKPRDLTL